MIINIAVDDSILSLGVILISVPIHELGHYLTTRYYGYKPKFAWHDGNPAVRYRVRSKDDHPGQALIKLSGSLFQFPVLLIPIILGWSPWAILISLSGLLGSYLDYWSLFTTRRTLRQRVLFNSQTAMGL